MRFLFCIPVILLAATCFSQKQQPSIFPESALNTVVVNKDPRLDVLSAKQAEVNNRASRLTSNGRVRGYRIQVINTPNRDIANQVKAEMLRRFPDEQTYLLYQAPNFRVRIGNFLKQNDASGLKKLISNLYPDRFIYVVQDVIEYTFKDDEDID